MANLIVGAADSASMKVPPKRKGNAILEVSKTPQLVQPQ